MHRFRAVISIGGLLLLWQCLVWTQWVNPEYFPGPGPTLQALWAGLVGGELLRALGQTLARALLGLLGATLLGIAVALLTARYKLLKRALDPVAEFFRPLPPAALVPMAIFFLGLGPLLFAFILLFACVWPVYLNAGAALAAVSTVQLRTASSFGYAGWDRVLKVQLPAALPEIFIGVRIAAGVALIAAVVTEMLAGRDGLGYQLNESAMTLRIPEMFAALLLAMGSGLALNALVRAVRGRVVRWHVVMTQSNRA
ncbi:MAG: ABC transporter permease [Proteobacteria bacterium]|nr:ABC transporter permease [Pseudomonadota bacterium]